MKKWCLNLFGCFLLIGTFFICVADAADFTHIVSFGDSLSDNGPDDGYGYDIYSDGDKVWVDYLAEDQSATLSGRAWGGATTGDGSPNLIWQVDDFVTNSTIEENTLFIIWAGGNDFLGGGLDVNVPVANICEALDLLIAAGAENILVNYLPDLGATPELNQTPKAGLARTLTINFNTALRSELDVYMTAYPDVDFYIYDVFELLDEIIAAPADYGFDNVTNMLRDAVPTPDEYLFWDEIHPTNAAHILLADYAADALAAPAVPEDPASDDDDEGSPASGGGSGGGGCFIGSIF